MSESPNIPTVVLVHGGFADASFWAPVIKDLQAHNLPGLARWDGKTPRERRSALLRTCSNSSGCSSPPSWPGHARATTSCSKTCSCATPTNMPPEPG